MVAFFFRSDSPLRSIRMELCTILSSIASAMVCSPLTSNQAAFQKMLQNGKVDFELRSVKDEVIDVFDNKRTVTIEKWIQTTGKGAEEADNLTTKILY